LAIVPCFRVCDISPTSQSRKRGGVLSGSLYYLVTHLYSSGRIWSTT
jgi:hypothetical protein